VGHQRFDISKLERLNDPGRFETLKTAAMWEALGSPHPQVIVEIGAGTGLFAAAFTELAPGAVVYAVDVEQVMIDWMHANRPEVEVGRIVPVRSHETSVPLDDGIADLVVMINVHHELAGPEETYREAWRLLRPGGQLLAVDWAPIETPRGPSQAVRVSAEDATALIASVGFTQIEGHGTLPWHWMVTGVRPA
jgi:SAM-dependent methyltransferase